MVLMRRHNIDFMLKYRKLSLNYPFFSFLSGALFEIKVNNMSNYSRNSIARTPLEP